LTLFLDENDAESFQPFGNEFLGEYNPNVDASATAEFSHCAFRIYHANLADHLHLLDENYKITKNMTIDECDIGLKTLETQFDEVVRGMLQTQAAESTFSAKIRNQLLNNDSKFKVGIDLISTDILSGRDNGLQPYYLYYELCTEIKITKWEDLLDTMTIESVKALQSVYASVFDVDTYVGLALEKRCQSYVGKVGKCLVRKQFEISRAGDRFFYSLPDGAYPFTRHQRQFIYNFNYASVLCTTTNMREVPSKAFEVPTWRNRMIRCKKDVDLSAWDEARFSFDANST